MATGLVMAYRLLATTTCLAECNSLPRSLFNLMTNESALRWYATSDPNKISQLIEGQDLKEQGQAKALAHAADEWKAAFAAEGERIALLGFSFTSERIVEVVGNPPNGSRNAIGAAMSALVKRLKLKRLDFLPSTKTSRHAGMIAVWIKPQ